jgi:hypothetical protein
VGFVIPGGGDHVATVTITQHWPDEGGCTAVEIDFDDSYPDAMSRAVDEALRAWLTATGADTDDDVI